MPFKLPVLSSILRVQYETLKMIFNCLHFQAFEWLKKPKGWFKVVQTMDLDHIYQIYFIITAYPSA